MARKRKRPDGDEPDWQALGVHPSELLDAQDADDRTVLDGTIRWGPLPVDELAWLSIIVTEPLAMEGSFAPSASRLWWASVGDSLIGAAFQYSALDYAVVERSWGIVFEVGFATTALADGFRSCAPLRSAVDQLGALRLEVSAGRGGGGAGARQPRRGRPLRGSGAAELPLPEPGVEEQPMERVLVRQA